MANNQRLIGNLTEAKRSPTFEVRPLESAREWYVRVLWHYDAARRLNRLAELRAARRTERRLGPKPATQSEGHTIGVGKRQATACARLIWARRARQSVVCREATPPHKKLIRLRTRTLSHQDILSSSATGDYHASGSGSKTRECTGYALVAFGPYCNQSILTGGLKSWTWSLGRGGAGAVAFQPSFGYAHRNSARRTHIQERWFNVATRAGSSVKDLISLSGKPGNRSWR